MGILICPLTTETLAGSKERPCTVALGFIAHMDNGPDASGENVKPAFVENYDGCPLGELEFETLTPPVQNYLSRDEMCTRVPPRIQ